MQADTVFLKAKQFILSAVSHPIAFLVASITKLICLSLASFAGMWFFLIAWVLFLSLHLMVWTSVTLLLVHRHGMCPTFSNNDCPEVLQPID
jgi:hypothetical protein